MSRPRKVSEHREEIFLDGIRVPFIIITEMGRPNARCSVTKRGVNVRIPYGMAGLERGRTLQNFRDWVRTTHAERPEVFERFRTVGDAKTYAFSLRDRDYEIRVRRHHAASHRIRYGGQDVLVCDYAGGEEPVGTVVEKMLAGYFGKYYLPEVTERVHALNEAHFQRGIRSVKLRDTYARWGSCSSKGNVSLATRLLLAPPAVLDAVIVHELAHLVEANHSAAFWAQVERALPNYREYDAWLRAHGGALRFRPIPLAGD